MVETCFLHGWGLSGVVWEETLVAQASSPARSSDCRSVASENPQLPHTPNAGGTPALRGPLVAQASLPARWSDCGSVTAESPTPKAGGTPALQVALDLPGYGATPPISPYTAETLADHVAASLERPVNLVGWSMGGMVALALAARHPDKVNQLVLVGTSPVFAARPDWPHAMPPEVLEQFARSLQTDYRDTLRRFLSLQARGGDAAREVIARLRERLSAQPEPAPETLAAGLELLATVDLRDQVAQVRCRTLVVHGALDGLCLPQAGRWLADHLPNGRLAWQERAAHAPFLSHPAWFVATLKEFLDG